MKDSAGGKRKSPEGGLGKWSRLGEDGIICMRADASCKSAGTIGEGGFGGDARGAPEAVHLHAGDQRGMSLEAKVNMC